MTLARFGLVAALLLAAASDAPTAVRSGQRHPEPQRISDDIAAVNMTQSENLRAGPEHPFDDPRSYEVLSDRP